MNVNGSRFHLLLGEADWGRCRVERAGTLYPLGDWWSGSKVPPEDEDAADTTLEPAPLVWDGLRRELRLQRAPIELAATPGEAALSLAARRAAAADRHGNIYRIDVDARRLRVWSVGSDRESAFWPNDTGDPVDRRADFAPIQTPVAVGLRFLALAVTEDHYLVAAFDGAGNGAGADSGANVAGLLTFDLMAGGPPHATRWPAGLSVVPFAMTARRGGGLWLLDRAARRLWELDRRLALVQRPAAPQPVEAAAPDLFQPLAGSARSRRLRSPSGGLDLGALGLADPIALTEQGASAVLILDRGGPTGPSRVDRLTWSAAGWRAETPVELRHPAHDLVLARASSRGADAAVPRVLVAAASGNQALAFAVSAVSEPFALRGALELFPLRRYGGRALLQVQGAAWYDTGGANPRWVPVVQQPRVRYREAAEFLTPVFDGQDLQCVWDRVLLDACCPADCRIEVWCRAADETLAPGTDAEALPGTWVRQPQPRLRSDGAELPWLRVPAQGPTRRESGAGTWELLLQGARGRYLQLRLRLTGNGTLTPWLRALRCWYPRLSYPARFLPAVYREDPRQGDFLERFLANMEGVNTELEGRIAQAQALFDPRCVPAESLDWLASWFDLALDPAWDERRRRLLVAHAMDFFRWRGTVHGLRVALALAFEPCIDASMFAGPAAACTRASGIRIVETYQTRLIGALAAGDPGAAQAGPRLVQTGAFWTPQEGASGLAERYARTVLGRDHATAAEQLRPFSLLPPADPAWSDSERARQQAIWTGFCRTQLGFVPAAGAVERQRWQGFLRTRYPDPESLANAHGLVDLGFDTVELPMDWPQQETPAADWRTYCARPEPTRARWQDFLARRYRRIERLRTAHQTHWPDFSLIPLPDQCPATPEAQTDWLQFERHLLAIVRTAHRFSVLLPVTSVNEDPAEMARRLGLARRIVALEKPAQTVFDVRFYWSLNRIGEARLGLDTVLDTGSRAKELMPDAVLGHAYLGAGFVGGPPVPADGDRRRLAC